jgi:hypothetical protein
MTSWVIVRKSTGEAVMETFNPKLVRKVINPEYEVVAD